MKPARNKLIRSLPFIVLIVSLAAYASLSIFVGRLLTASEFARFSITVGKSLSHPREGGPSRTLALLRSALSTSSTAGVIDFDGKQFSFPLPKYVVPQTQDQDPGSYHFIAFVNPDEMSRYFSRELPDGGWLSKEQMGAAHFLEGHDARMRIQQRFYLTSDISEFDVSIRNR